MKDYLWSTNNGKSSFSQMGVNDTDNARNYEWQDNEFLLIFLFLDFVKSLLHDNIVKVVDNGL